MSNQVFYNGDIHTLDARYPTPEAIAIKQGKIQAVGNVATLKELSTPNTQWVNLHGQTLLPSFFDAHIHIWKVGDLLTYNLDLRGVGSIEELQDKLADFSRKNKEVLWLRARGFNEAQMKEGRLPTCQDIDKVVKDRPVFLQRTCAHIATVNTQALELCGIHKKTPIPFGGEIRRDAAGELNGVLSETALGLAFNHFPAFTGAEYENMILAACQLLMAHGITAATDPAVMPDLLAVYQKMNREGRLPMRIHAMPIILPDGSDTPCPIPELYASDNLVINTVKFFADGGLSGATAAISRPYKNTNYKGVLRLDPKQYFQLALEAQQKGFQIGTHAIGDVAIDFVLDIYERLYQAQPNAPKHRIEHLGLPLPTHLQRIQKMGVHAVPQAIFLKEVGLNFRNTLDDQFLSHCYPIRSMLDHQINVAFSTDAPVVKNVNPFACIAAAMLRQDETGTSIAPTEKIDFKTALYCYTMGSALANRVADKTGSLSIGKEADMIALATSPFEMPATDLADLTVHQVWRKGQLV